MGRLAAPVAAGRLAVRRALTGVPAGELVLVACSGGPDSMALAWLTGFVAPRLGLRAGLVTVDHGLQTGSAERAGEVVGWAGAAGLVPAEVVTVDVGGYPGGPEAAARQARYEALAHAAHRYRAVAVLLGHSLDDQAETVLLALARGAGPRGIAGMPARREIDGVPFLRPLLDQRRAALREVCDLAGLRPWHDPHNTDPGFARSRLRAALAELAGLLGPDLVTNLARTARLVGTDLAALDSLAAVASAGTSRPDGSLSVPELAALDPAIRGRVLRRYALAHGVTPAALSAVHLDRLDALVCGWHGQGPVALPGGIWIGRQGGRLQPVTVDRIR